MIQIWRITQKILRVLDKSIVTNWGGLRVSMAITMLISVILCLKVPNISINKCLSAIKEQYHIFSEYFYVSNSNVKLTNGLIFVLDIATKQVTRLRTWITLIIQTDVNPVEYNIGSRWPLNYYTKVHKR